VGLKRFNGISKHATRIFPWLIERSAQFIRKYGITSVFLARFTAVVRAFVPLLAGIMRMSSRQFYVANIL
jgi:membrane protein DedA with SNARE-associated domain